MMAKQSATLNNDIRLSDYLSVGLLARIIPPQVVDSALSHHGRHSQRQRDFPADTVAYYIIAMSMYRDVNTEEVMRIISEGMSYLGNSAVKREVGKSAISASRTRLGAEVMKQIAEQVCQPLAMGEQSAGFYKGLRVVTIDGTTLEVDDQQSHRDTFGVPGTGQGKTGYPQIRCVSLLENATGVLFSTTLGGYHDDEKVLAVDTLKQLKPDMLCLADRGFLGYPLWQTASETGANLLWRVAKNRNLPVLKSLPDGSYLSEIYPSKETLKKMDNQSSVKPITVRVIDYKMPLVSGGEPVYRLITTLLDHEAYPSLELAHLYHERWHIETAFAELKTTLKGSDVILRSRTPELVRQEFWGLMLAHYVVRKIIFEAAVFRKEEPKRLSFKHGLSIIRRKLPVSGSFSPSGL
jgi:hypothetical protein